MITRALLTLALCLCLGLAPNSWAAIGFGTIGAIGTGSTSAAPAYPASLAAGDMLVLCIASKGSATTPTQPSGWTTPANNTAIGNPSEGTGNDLGPVVVTLFHKTADGSESGTLTVSVSGGGSTSAFIARYTRTDGTFTWVAPVAEVGVDDSPGTSWSTTMGADPVVTTNDFMVACSAAESTAGVSFSAEAITQTGVTFAAGANERADNGTSTGDDTLVMMSDHAVTGGPSDGAHPAVYTATSGSTRAGATVLLRLRETGASATAIQSSQGWMGVIQ